MELIPYRNRDMWRGLSTLQDEMERAFSPWFSSALPSIRMERFTPSVDMSEDQDNIYVEMNLPGMEQKDINVKTIGNVLEISAKKEETAEEQNRDYYCCERYRGRFYRALDLPSSVDTSGIEAKTKNGVLTITLPKKEEEKAKEIDIKVE